MNKKRLLSLFLVFALLFSAAIPAAAAAPDTQKTAGDPGNFWSRLIDFFRSIFERIDALRNRLQMHYDVKREGVTMEHCEGDAAYYQPAVDRIVLPLLKQFAETAEYYSTAFHEMVHSTGHMKRLARLEAPAHFGSEDYSKEELIAEIGSSALVHHCGLETPESFRNSTSYVQNWLQVLKNDKRFIVSAAGKAEKAVNLILGEGQ